MRKMRKYTQLEKDQVMQFLSENGDDYKKASKHFGIPNGTVWSWINKTKTTTTNDVQVKYKEEIKQLKFRVNHLELRETILKNMLASSHEKILDLATGNTNELR